MVYEISESRSQVRQSCQLSERVGHGFTQLIIAQIPEKKTYYKVNRGKIKFHIFGIIAINKIISFKWVIMNRAACRIIFFDFNTFQECSYD